jgi:hypothetical protein
MEAYPREGTRPGLLARMTAGRVGHGQFELEERERWEKQSWLGSRNS